MSFHAAPARMESERSRPDNKGREVRAWAAGKKRWPSKREGVEGGVRARRGRWERGPWGGVRTRVEGRWPLAPRPSPRPKLRILARAVPRRSRAPQEACTFDSRMRRFFRIPDSAVLKMRATIPGSRPRPRARSIPLGEGGCTFGALCLLSPEQKLSDSKGCILSTTGADKEPNSGKLHLQGETHGFEET